MHSDVFGITVWACRNPYVLRWLYCHLGAILRGPPSLTKNLCCWRLESVASLRHLNLCGQLEGVSDFPLVLYPVKSRGNRFFFLARLPYIFKIASEASRNLFLVFIVVCFLVFDIYVHYVPLTFTTEIRSSQMILVFKKTLRNNIETKSGGACF